MQLQKRRRYAKIDRFFLVAFPLMFLVFNIVYWLYYYQNPMNINKMNAEEEEESRLASATTESFLLTSPVPSKFQEVIDDEFSRR